MGASQRERERLLFSMAVYEVPGAIAGYQDHNVAAAATGEGNKICTKKRNIGILWNEVTRPTEHKKQVTHIGKEKKTVDIHLRQFSLSAPKREREQSFFFLFVSERKKGNVAL